MIINMYHNIQFLHIFEYDLVLFDLMSIPRYWFYDLFSFTLNVPLGFFINETRITVVGNKLAVNKAIINEIEQTNVTK